MSSKRGTAPAFSGCPKEAREHRIEETARALRQSIHDEGASYAVIAAYLGLSESEMKRCASPTSGRHLSLADAAGLPPAIALRIARWMVEPFGASVIELPDAEDPGVDLHALATITREASDVVASGLDAASDGHITRAEGAVLERECDEAIAALLRVREIAKLAQREGVVGCAGRMHS